MPWADYQQAFYNAMYPLAQQASAATGIDADIIFAQAALETGWGKHVVGNNYFGIKGSGVGASTKEFINGVWVTVKDSFKGFSSMADSVSGYIDFINGNRRYQSVKNAPDTATQLSALGRSGYATDPSYVSKLASIIKSIPGGARGWEKNVLDSIGLDGGWWTDPNASLTDLDPTGTSGFIKSFFNGEMAGRFAAVIIGIILVALAIAAFVLTSDSGKQVIKLAATKGM